MSDLPMLACEDLIRIGRAVGRSATAVQRVLTGVDDSPEARRIRALSEEAIARAPACRRIRVVTVNVRNAP